MADDAENVDRRIGNKFWEARSTHGRDLIFANPDIFWAACVEYFEWVVEHPLYEAQAFANQGCVTQEYLPKMRAMTIEGACLFLGISRRTWDDYRVRDDFMPVVARAEDVMRNQKFGGAAAGLLNPSIIARDLCLKESTSNEHTGANGGPIKHSWNILPVTTEKA